MHVFAAELIITIVRQQPPISLQSLEFAVRGSSTWLTPAFVEFKAKQQATAAARHPLFQGTAASSSFDAVEFLWSGALPFTSKLAVAGMEVCHSLISKDTAGLGGQLALLSEDMFSLSISCLKLTPAAAAVGVTAAPGLTSSGGSGSSSSGCGGRGEGSGG